MPPFWKLITQDSFQGRTPPPQSCDSQLAVRCRVEAQAGARVTTSSFPNHCKWRAQGGKRSYVLLRMGEPQLLEVVKPLQSKAEQAGR